MDTKVITCRTHGGTFRVPVKRGRPPVNCTPENKCRKPKAQPAPATPAQRVVAQGKPIPRATLPVLPTAEAVRNVSAKEAAAMVKPAQTVPERRTAKPLGVTKAFQAKAQLEALGWEVTGANKAGAVTVTATRGTELLTITWDTANGELLSQEYSLWDTTVGTGRNGKPQHKLPFDPEELPDAELVRVLSGMKVTWWNSLSQSENSDVIQPGTIKIEHSYETNGDEVYGDRIVKFIGYGGGGFRAFRLAALIKVG